MLKKTFNSQILKLREFKSHTPNILGFTAHPILEEGSYMGVVYKKDQVLRRINLECNTEAQDSQLNIDFTEHDNAFILKKNQSIPKYSLKKEGYILLYTSSQLGEYSFKLFLLNDQRQKLVFDSKSLDTEDIYTVTLLEPGDYTAKSTSSESKMRILVTIPAIETGKPFEAPEPINVEVSDMGFNKSEIKTNSSQGIVFLFKAKTDVLITFETDINREEFKKDQPIFHWRNFDNDLGNTGSQ